MVPSHSNSKSSLLSMMLPPVVGIIPFAVSLYRWYTSKQIRSNDSTTSSSDSSSSSTVPQPLSTTTLLDAVSIIQSWRTMHLALDVGASNVRIAFHNPDTQQVVSAPKMECRSMTELLSYMAEIEVLLENEKSNLVTEAACLALAGPVAGDHVIVTNYTASDNSIHKNDLPPRLFPQGGTYFLNDLEACSFGIVRMGLMGDLWEYFEPRTGADKLLNQHYAVLAMGTGLGASLVYSKSVRQSGVEAIEFDVMPLELGHIFTAHELAQDDRDRLDFIAERVYSSNYAPEVEDICSGRGLIACYDYEIRNEPERKSLRAREIAELVAQGDEFAQRAMYAHYKILYKAAQHMCILVPQCKGVFLAGDNQVINEAFVQNHLEDFENEFRNHPKKEWLKDVTIYRQARGLNMNVQGAFYYIGLHSRK